MELMPDLTIVPMWFLFITSVLVLNRFVFQPTLLIVREREKLTIGHRNQAVENLQKAESKLKAYEAILADARLAGRKKREENLKKAGLKQKELLDEARLKAEGYLSQFRVDLQAETEKAKAHLNSDATTLSDEIVNRLVA